MASSDSIPGVSNGSNTHFSSAGDMKFHLQALLDSKEKQLQQAGTLGQRVLAQQMELEERIRQLQELELDKAEDDEIDLEARLRYRELEDTILAWDSENAQLSGAFGASKRLSNGHIPSPTFATTEFPREETERSKPPAGTSAAQSRRAKNAAHRADDVEFAFEIGSGLLTEVRRLQSLLGERDKAIQDMKEEKDDLEKSVESLRTALREQEQSSDKFKEENWNLEVTLQELRVHLTDSQSTTQRLESEHKRITKLLATARDAGDQHKNEAERLQNVVTEMKAKHETDVAQARKHAAGLARDKSDLQQTIDKMKSDAARANKRLPRFGSPLTPNGAGGTDYLTPGGEGEDDDVFTHTGGASTNRRKVLDTSMMFPSDEYPDSPEVSPVRPPFLAPNHPINEMEALQQRLAHAQRQISTLKGTLQREKQLKMDYRSRLEAANGSVLPDEDENEDDYEDEETVADKTAAAIKPRQAGHTPYRTGGRGGRGRTHGRGGLTLIERLGMAANSPAFADDYDQHHDSHPPPVPQIPIHFTQADDVDDEEGNALFGSSSSREEERVPPRSPSPLEQTHSNRSSVVSVDGMDPAFANVLRRVPSNGSSYSGSPLRHSLLGRSTRARPRGAATVGRRPRGGASYKETRPASLVDAPDVLSAEMFENDISGDTGNVSERLAMFTEELEIETAEFGCQTEPEERPASVVPVKVDMEMQTEPEESTPVLATLRTDMGIQSEPPSPSAAKVSSGINTDLLPVVAKAQVEIQTISSPKADAETQTLPEPLTRPSSFASPDMSRRTTITQLDISNSSIGADTTITRSTARTFLASTRHEEEAEDDGDETETGAETETDTDDYHDARQSIMMSTPSESREDFRSLLSMSDNEYPESDESDDESIKASRLPSLAQTSSHSMSGSGRPSSFYDAIPKATYESVGVSADLLPLPEPLPLSVPPPVVEAIPEPPPKPEVKEMSIQTDEWTPPVPVPVVTNIPPGFGLYRVGSANQQFQFVAPPGASRSPTPSVIAAASNAQTVPTTTNTIPIPIPIPTPTTSVFRDSAGTFGRARTSAADRRQSIESAISSVPADDLPRSRAPSTTLSVVDKTRPPMMVLPPPPRLPPPPNTMPPPNFIPDRRVPTSSIGSFDGPPPRPSSPPPAELIQRATTPTFGSALSVPTKSGLTPFRQHGSSMPSQQVRQLPSTSSFRSAANAANYAQSTTAQSALSSFNVRERERREFSTTSLASGGTMASPRSSMSSEHNPYLQQVQNAASKPTPATPDKTLDADITPRGPPGGVSTDPHIIHAITQTMIGEFLYKYMRRPIGKGHGERRHKRFFWVHPYTKTLYWSSADPGSSNVSESSAKSAYIEGVRSVLDPNPMPPGLYQYSVVVSTPQREMKITAPTKERHDIWLNALKYLLSRPAGTNITSPATNTGVPQSPASMEFEDEDARPDLTSSPQSQRVGRSTRPAEWNVTPRGQRSRSQISVGGSVGKRSGTPALEYLRWNNQDSPYSPSKSFVEVPSRGSGELDFELHGESMSDDGFEGLENVRACCDGKHTVGHSGKIHHHHHHAHLHGQFSEHQVHPHNGNQQHQQQQQSQHGHHLEASASSSEQHHARPASPAWSFRSRTGSAHSHENGGNSIFSWGRKEDGKLRFGSRRSTKTVPTQES